MCSNIYISTPDGPVDHTFPLDLTGIEKPPIKEYSTYMFFGIFGIFQYNTMTYLRITGEKLVWEIMNQLTICDLSEGINIIYAKVANSENSIESLSEGPIMATSRIYLVRE